MDRVLSVTEYATLTGKDPGNIRRLLASGRIEGWKVGNQWVVSSNAEYPEDRRTKSGNYRNWRKRVSLNSNKALMSVIKDLIKEYTDVYGSILSEVVLYGSYARGEQSEESDVDIALILKDKPSAEMTRRMIDYTAAGELKADKVLSVIDIQEAQFEHWKDILPYYQNILKEGIVLWKNG